MKLMPCVVSLIALLLCSFAIHGATVITDDFDVDSSANWTGTTFSVDSSNSNTMQIPGDGLVVHDTEVSGDEAWIRVTPTGSLPNYLLVIGADSSGNGIAYAFRTDTTGGQQAITQYTTYTTWANNDTTYSSMTHDTNPLGVTIDRTSRILRIWVGVTAAEPDSLTSWDARAADSTIDFSGEYAIPGNYVGLGSWSGGTTNIFDDFTAGNFGTAAGANIPAIMHHLQRMKRR